MTYNEVITKLQLNALNVGLENFLHYTKDHVNEWQGTFPLVVVDPPEMSLRWPNTSAVIGVGSYRITVIFMDLIDPDSDRSEKQTVVESQHQNAVNFIMQLADNLLITGVEHSIVKDIEVTPFFTFPWNSHLTAGAVLNFTWETNPTWNCESLVPLTPGSGSGGGGGQPALSSYMLKSVYDTNNDGCVDFADEATAITGADAAGNNQYYGTNASGAVGFYGLADVALSGAYADLSGTPSLAAVATTGDYNDLVNTPSIPADTDDLSEGATNLYYTAERVDDQVNNLLVAGTNITLTYNDAAGTLTIDAAGGGGGSPGGSNTQVQYNDSGSFAGATKLIYNSTKPFGDTRVRVVDGDFEISDGNLSLGANPSTLTTQFGKAKIYYQSFPSDRLFAAFGAGTKQIAFLTPDFGSVTGSTFHGANQTGLTYLGNSASPFTITLSRFQGTTPLQMRYYNMGTGTMNIAQGGGTLIANKTAFAQGEGCIVQYIPQSYGTSFDNNWIVFTN